MSVEYNVSINSYAEVGDAADPCGGVFDGSITVRTLPSQVALRTAWLIRGLEDMPGYLPIARLTLAHHEPGSDRPEAVDPTIYHPPLDRWDGSSVLFLSYTVHVRSIGAHRIEFPKVETPEFAVAVRTAESHTAG